VSRVINNNAQAKASAETRQRILRAVETLAYRPNVAARGLRMSRTFTLGMLVPDLTNPMYAAIAKGAQERAETSGFGLVLGSHTEGESEATFAPLLRQGRVDGLLVASGLLRDSFIRRIAVSGGGPVVLVNRRVRGVGASVVLDDAAGAATAVQHLVDLGHSRIAGIFGPDYIDTAQRRRKGFQKACAEAGVEGTVAAAPAFGAAGGYTCAMELLEDPDGAPSAIFASAFVMGIGVLRAARELKVATPRRLAVVALHDSELADYLAPPLTTVALPAEDMGATAVDQVVGMLNGSPGRNVVVRGTPRLVVRGSTARPLADMADGTIVEVGAATVQAQLPAPVVFGEWVMTVREYVVVRLLLDDGTSGWSFTLTRDGSVADHVRRTLAGIYTGTCVHDREATFRTAWKRSPASHAAGIGLRALSVMDLAAWDAAARHRDVSVPELLSGAPSPLPATAIIGYPPGTTGPAEIADQVRELHRTVGAASRLPSPPVQT
jgi:LacI family transcriptional regulator